MILLSEFIETKSKSRFEHLNAPHVPIFWGGYYAIYQPKTKYNNTENWLKRWHKRKTGKIIATAFAVNQITNAHEQWNSWINQ